MEHTKCTQICLTTSSVNTVYEQRWLAIQISCVLLTGTASGQRAWLCTARALAPCPPSTWLHATRVLQSSSTLRLPLAWEWLSLTPRRPTASMPSQSECTPWRDDFHWKAHSLYVSVIMYQVYMHLKKQPLCDWISEKTNTQILMCQINSATDFNLNDSQSQWVTALKNKIFSIAPSGG